MMGARFWRDRALLGVTLGAAIATLDFAHYAPVVSPPGGIGFQSYLSSLMTWCSEGLLYSLIVAVAERRARPRDLRGWELAAAVAAGVLVGVLLWQTFSLFVLRDLVGLRLFRDHVGQPVVWLGGVLYHVWLLSFFGGLVAAVQASHRWRARVLATLRREELERAASQRRLAQARLDALRARIDPDYVFATFSRLEGLYETDTSAADQLLDELIVFLRKALGETRASPYMHGQSTNVHGQFTKGEPDEEV
jgi:hypothetical protein